MAARDSNPFQVRDHFVYSSDRAGRDEISPLVARRTFLTEENVFGHWHGSRSNWERTPNNPQTTWQTRDRMVSLRNLANLLSEVTRQPSTPPRVGLRPRTHPAAVRADPKDKYDEIILTGSVSKGNPRLTFGPRRPTQGARRDTTVVPKFKTYEDQPAGFFLLLELANLGPTETARGGSSEWLKGTQDSYTEFFWGPKPPTATTRTSYILWRPLDPSDGPLARRTLATLTEQRAPRSRGWRWSAEILLPDGSLNTNTVTATRDGIVKEI